MQIHINMNTMDKYIHAQEVTVTKANPVLDTSLLSSKGKELLVKLQENPKSFYFKMTTVDLNVLKNELNVVVPPAPTLSVNLLATSDTSNGQEEVTTPLTATITGLTTQLANGTVITLTITDGTTTVNTTATVQTDGSYTVTDVNLEALEGTITVTATSGTLTATDVETITPTPVVLPVTYNILKTGNTLVVTFSEPVKYNGLPLEDYAGSSIDFIKNTSYTNQSSALLDQALDETKVVLNTTATSYSLRLEQNFFNKDIFKALDDSFVGGPDEWAGNEDGFYRIDFLFKPEAFTSLTDVVVPANTINPTVDELKITVYTTASQTVTQHTAEDYENSNILGVFDNTPVYIFE